MKTRFLFAALLLLTFGSLKAQETLIPVPDGNASKINTLVVSGTGSVYLKQGDKLTMNDYGHNTAKYHVEDSVLYLEGTGTREVTIQNLAYLKVTGTAGVRSKGQLKGENLSIYKTGTGVLSLEVGYNNIYVRSCGTGDVILLGDCNVFCGETKSLGKNDAKNLNYKVLIEKSSGQWNMAFNINDELTDPKRHFLNELVNNAAPFFEAESNRSWDHSSNDKAGYEALDTLQLKELMRELGVNLQQLSDSVDWEKFEQDMEQWGAEMEEWGRKMEKWGERYEDKNGKHYEYNNDRPAPKEDKPKSRRPVKKNLLFDANWNGFEAGLNMLFGPGTAANFNNDYAFLEQRPMKSWVFNFNIADVGIAFDRRHIAGLYTGIGLGWNNYSFNNPVRLVKGENHLEGQWIDPSEAIVKNSKLGVLYVQAPLMIEVRPTRRFYIAAGVTGGLRVDTWTKIRFQNGDKTKVHSDYYVNPYKLDASLRVGGRSLGFFAYYNLLPTFDEAHGPTSHTASFGFSLNF